MNVGLPVHEPGSQERICDTYPEGPLIVTTDGAERFTGGEAAPAVAASPTLVASNSVNHRLPDASCASAVASPVTPCADPNTCVAWVEGSKRSSSSSARSKVSGVATSRLTAIRTGSRVSRSSSGGGS